uniref:Gcp-like domain-containing protein n=1 Tax=Paulinella chromatophora TaxID=39717 RepID=B1X483_PAUCH|nr:hypothetical protein PCC_0311 [Paulinella chromatophora]ACB42752.1 hypothetical protein PCC_0311 [Paulinella chromatophora]
MPLILALHSSSNTLGVACGPCQKTSKDILKVASFPIGKRLSNDLLSCVESVLPAKEWGRLKRLAVATGPGSFTSTRLAIIMARTLCQQLHCPLDGINTLLLAAHRFQVIVAPFRFERHFWLTQTIAQSGIVAGRYSINELNSGEVREWVIPSLMSENDVEQLEPRFTIQVDVEKDVIQLLRLSQSKAENNFHAPWNIILPAYVTSPVEGISR